MSQSPTVLPHTEDNKTLIYKQADLFANLPDTAIIVHSTNCQGTWGAGFALSLKKKCPVAFKIYQNHCKSATSDELKGTCLLIKPEPTQVQTRSRSKSEDNVSSSRKWYIACLFTSVGYGKRRGGNPGVSAKEDILGYTDSALRDLRRQICDLDEQDGPRELFSPKFNAGRFAVPWESTAELIDLHFGGTNLLWTVFCPVDELPSLVVDDSEEHGE